MTRNPVTIEACVWEEWLSFQSASIPPLPDVAPVSSRVTRILAGNPGPFQLQGTNTYLVGTGKNRILIDTGEGKRSWIEAVVSFLSEHQLSVSHVLLTHWHGDHTGGVPDLLSPDRDLGLTEDDVYKHTPDAGQQPIHDGQVFSAPGATLRAVHTPGHAADHCCFVLEEEGALFTGDNVLGHGYSVDEDLATYVASLRRMGELGCRVGYPAHGDIIADLPGTIGRYVRHKEDRERMVVGALAKVRDGRPGRGGGVAARGRSVRGLVGEMHGDLPEEMVEKALVPAVSQILDKLAREKRVGFGLVRGVKYWFLMA